MKIVLLALDGDVERARKVIANEFSTATIVPVRRSDFEKGSLTSRIKLFRDLRPDVLAISLENLTSQRGQNELALFSALSGARELVLIDARGGLRREGRSRSLYSAPARISHEALLSALTLFESRLKLRTLEKAVRRRKPYEINKATRLPKITFIRATPGPGTQVGGASSHVNGFLDAALKLGTPVRVLTNDRIAGLDESKLPVVLIPLERYGLTRSVFDLRNNLLFTNSALRDIKVSPPDLVYQRYSRFTWAGVAASLAASAPFFLEYNGSEVWVGKHWDDVGMLGLLEKFEQLNLKAADRIFVVADVERSNLINAGVNKDKIVVNPNGVDLDQFRPGVGGASIRSRVAISDDVVVVGFVGSFGPWHGVAELAKAITLIPRETKVKFLMIGTGKLREQAEATIAASGFSDRVVFTGAVPHDQVPGLLDACDILVSPHIPLADGSDFFGSPTKLFEYMAMGKAIVASNLGQIGEVLSHEKTALLVEPADINALSAAILRLIKSPSLRSQLGEASRSEAVKNHSWSRNAECVLREYQALADSKSGASSK